MDKKWVPEFLHGDNSFNSPGQAPSIHEIGHFQNTYHSRSRKGVWNSRVDPPFGVWGMDKLGVFFREWKPHGIFSIRIWGDPGFKTLVLWVEMLAQEKGSRLAGKKSRNKSGAELRWEFTCSVHCTTLPSTSFWFFHPLLYSLMGLALIHGNSWLDQCKNGEWPHMDSGTLPTLIPA